MKNILFFFLCALANLAFAENKTIYTNDSTKCVYETKNGMLDGEYRSYYKNGKMKTEGSFLQNNRFGTWTFYQPDGNIARIRDYRNNNSYQEKGNNINPKNVTVNAGKHWTLIAEKNVLLKKRFFRTLNMKNNSQLSAMVILLNNLMGSSQAKIFTDSRFTTLANLQQLKDEEIIAFKLKEDIIIDKTSLTMQFRIIGIAPLYFSTEKNSLQELCWLYYPDLKNEMDKIISPDKNNRFCNTLLDVFEYRNFNTAPGDIIPLNPTADGKESLPVLYPDVDNIETENSYIAGNYPLN